MTDRRFTLRAAAAAAFAGIAGPFAVAARAAEAALPRMTDGPFYPSPDYRARSLDWDADLTRTGEARAPAEGEHLDLAGRIVDAAGRPIDACSVEIWQCDAFGSYRHPNGAGSRVDPGFQGFGASRSDGEGRYRFRTIRPVPYSGRTPHIHVKLRHPTYGELTSQLFVAGDPGNPRDFLWSRLSPAQRGAAEMRLERAAGNAGAAWRSERTLVFGA